MQSHLHGRPHGRRTKGRGDTATMDAVPRTAVAGQVAMRSLGRRCHRRIAKVPLGHGWWWCWGVVGISSCMWWWWILMRWIPVSTADRLVAVCSVVRGGHCLGPRRLRRRHIVLLYLGIIRVQIGDAAKGRVLPLEGQLALGRGSQQCVLGRFRRSCRRCGGWK